MEFRHLPEMTRSCRRYIEDRRIPLETLRSMVNAARLAPSAANLQLLRFSIHRDRESCDRIFPSVGWAGYLEDWDGPAEGERPAAYLMIHAPDEGRPFTPIDTGIAAAYMVLAARDLGLGSCMILSFDREAVGGAFHVPGHHVALVIALGVPGEEIVLEETDGPVEYWRDEEGVHHVPKLDLDSLIVDTVPRS